MSEWVAEFPRLRLDQMASAGIDLLLIDINRSHSAVSDVLSHWSPFLSKRAAILAYVSDGTGSEGGGTVSGGEGTRALLAFSLSSPLEPWAVYSTGHGAAAVTMLLRDPLLRGPQESHGAAGPEWGPNGTCQCWGCGAPVLEKRDATMLLEDPPTTGDKWDVTGVYINIDATRELRMEKKIRKLGPKATLSRFQGKDGATEEICQRIGKCTRTEDCADSSTVCCTLSHWLAIHSFFQENSMAEYFLVVEDDINFDLVPYWPGSLAQLLDHASQVHPEYQIHPGYQNRVSHPHRGHQPQNEMGLTFSLELRCLNSSKSGPNTVDDNSLTFAESAHGLFCSEQRLKADELVARP